MNFISLSSAPGRHLLGQVAAIAALLLLSAPAARAERVWRLYGALAGEYYQRSYSLVGGGPEDRETQTSGHLDLGLEGAFWSRDLLRYNLRASIETGSIDNHSTTGSIASSGFAAELRFFPTSRRKFTLRLGKNTYAYDKDTGPDYDRSTSYQGLEVIWGAWTLEALRSESKVAAFPWDDRMEERGRLSRYWTGAHTTARLDLRHDAYSYEFFGTEFTQQTGQFSTNTLLGEESTLNSEVQAMRYEYTNRGVGVIQDVTFGSGALHWIQQWSPSYQSQFEIRASAETEGDWGGRLRHLSRFRLTPGFMAEAGAGYVAIRQADRDTAYPFLSLGGYWAPATGAWSPSARFGVEAVQRDPGDAGGREMSAYLQLGVARDWDRTHFGLNCSYNGLSSRFEPPSAEAVGAGLEETFSATRDDWVGRVELSYRGLGPADLRYFSQYNQYIVEDGLLGDWEARNLTHQIDATLGSAMLGIAVASAEHRQSGQTIGYDTMNMHFHYTLNSHLTLQGFALRRDRRLAGVEAREEELNLQMRYAVGKFSLVGWFQQMESNAYGAVRSVRSIRILLVRVFGND